MEVMARTTQESGREALKGGSPGQARHQATLVSVWREEKRREEGGRKREGMIRDVGGVREGRKDGRREVQ